MRVLVTGAGGFIGSAAADYLTASGFDVVGLFRRTPESTSSLQEVVTELGTEEAGNVLTSSCKPCDAIVHTAACLDEQLENEEVTRTNCVGLQQLLQVAREWGVQRFVFVSGVTVIGKPVIHPITEQHPVAPRNVYTCTKHLGEQLVDLAASPQMSTVSLRVTAPVGAGMPTHRILSTFVRQAMQHEQLTLVGKGTRVQNYVDVRDVATAIELSLRSEANGVFNIGGAVSISNRDLAEMCVQLLNSKSGIHVSECETPDDNLVWDVSSKSAGEVLDYQPAHDIQSSILAVAECYDNCSSP